ncbi:MAG: hypothetical protein ABJC63_12780 [Gemmatimonadales bacterium]
MTDPTRFSDEERARQAVRDQTDAARQLDPAFTDPIREDQYPATRPDEPVDSRDRLFSRKVLFGWAFAALIFVFIIRMVLPVALETAKESFVSSIKESVQSTGGSGAAVVAPTPPVAPTAVSPAVPEVPEKPGAPAVAPSVKPKATTVQAPKKKFPR